MAVTARPVHRALRRVAVGDPAQWIRPRLARLPAATATALRALLGRLCAAVVRPSRAALEELLGGPLVPAVQPPPPPPASMAALIRRPPLDEKMAAFLVAHRRRATFAGCLLLIGAAAVAGMPLPSAAADVTAGSSPMAAAQPSAPDAVALADGQTTGGSSQAGADQEVGAVQADVGDASIFNVIEAPDVGSVGSGFRIYIVKAGDTLARIGAQFGVSQTTMYWANSTRLSNPPLLHVGQRLVVPPANGITVSIEDGVTLQDLEIRYDVSVLAIQAANRMGDANLISGQLILVPITAPAIPTLDPSPCTGCGGGGGGGWDGPKLRWPVPYSKTITQYFSRTHAALDIGANSGSHVIAAVGGKVIYSGWKTSGLGAGGGIEIWINTGGKLWTTYNHLSHSYVRVGQTVRAGQHIANVGQTGNATGPHLHFEAWVCYPWSGGGTGCARDPLSMM